MASRKTWESVRKILPREDFSQNLRGNAARPRCTKSRYYPKIRDFQTVVLLLPEIHKSEEQGHRKNFNNNEKFLFSLAFVSVAYAMAEKETKQESSEIIAAADALYEKVDFVQLYELLSKHKDSKNAEILWRLARAAYEYSAMLNTPKDVKKRLVFEGLQIAEEALNIDGNLFACHKWCGIMLSEVGDYLGSKVKIQNSYKIKEHFMKSIELNPSDATSHYLLGMWFYTFADLAWYQRKAAAVIFATPPSGTYKEAQDHFLHAESSEVWDYKEFANFGYVIIKVTTILDVDPNFYSANQLMLGTTYLKMGDNESAKKWLTKLLVYPAKTDEDKENVKKAKEHLKTL